MLRYSDDYRGVFLSYSRPVVLQHCGKILDEQPHIHLEVKYEAYIFKPTIGEVMCGTINKIGDGHVGCLVHHCFNASVISRRSMTQNDRKTLNGWFDTGQFDIGSKIWFRVSGLDNVSGILVIQGEYCNVGRLAVGSIDEASSSRKRKRTEVELNSSDGCLGTKKKKKKETDVDTLLHCHDDAESETIHVLSEEERKQKKRKRKTKDRDLERGVSEGVVENGSMATKRRKKRKKKDKEQSADISKHDD